MSVPLPNRDRFSFARMKTVSRFVFCLLLVLPPLAGFAAPTGYSVNSDEPLGDSLFAIDLATGIESQIGKVQSLGSTRTDIEGLAFDRFGVLWGVDDESGNFFPINSTNGQVVYQDEVPLDGLGALQGNDFGLTFTCGSEIFLTSVSTQSLYQLSLDGKATLVGNEGALGVRISAIAAWGKNPTRLYGLGNGLLGDGGPQDNRSLYEIDPATGMATLIGNIGAAAADYFEAGLSFDDNGTLWAITDRRTVAENLGSQVLTLDTVTGKATLVSTTTVSGFESLAIAPPGGCEDDPDVEPEPGTDDYEPIPTIGPAGMLLVSLLLLFTGLVSVRRRLG